MTSSREGAFREPTEGDESRVVRSALLIHQEDVNDPETGNRSEAGHDVCLEVHQSARLDAQLDDAGRQVIPNDVEVHGRPCR